MAILGSFFDQKIFSFVPAALLRSGFHLLALLPTSPARACLISSACSCCSPASRPSHPLMCSRTSSAARVAPFKKLLQRRPIFSLVSPPGRLLLSAPCVLVVVFCCGVFVFVFCVCVAVFFLKVDFLLWCVHCFFSWVGSVFLFLLCVFVFLCLLAPSALPPLAWFSRLGVPPFCWALFPGVLPGSPFSAWGWGLGLSS